MRSHKESAASRNTRDGDAQNLLYQWLTKKGWRVRREVTIHGVKADMVASHARTSYLVEIKAATEGRADRLVALWSQAFLQATRLSGSRYRPLAVVAAPKVSERAAEQVVNFAAAHAPGAALGVMDFSGFRLFRGPGLKGLDSLDIQTPSLPSAIAREPANLFSDLNQWMLKVLLAPELSEKLLSAPRGRYRNASQLARASHASVMSASRLLQQLRREGHLHESKGYLSLVRRDELFHRWQGSALRQAKEAPMRFLLRGDPDIELRRMLKNGRACLGLFAAAEALGVGHVHGVPPHVLVEWLTPASAAMWKNLVPANSGEAPDIILRRANSPKSVFRGAVQVKDIPVCDVLQVWLDVSSHPTRGREQSALIAHRVLDSLVRGKHANG